MLSIIVAVAKNNVIGKDNKLLWHLSEDLKRFKRLTMNKNIIMGRKTFESLGRVLPNRKHIILCNDMNLIINDENVLVLDNISKLDYYINSNDENFVIGGGTIYKLLMPFVSKLYVTHIDEAFEGDVYFPEIDLKIWKKISEEDGVTNEENPYSYKYVTYIRK